MMTMRFRVLRPLAALCLLLPCSAAMLAQTASDAATDPSQVSDDPPARTDAPKATVKENSEDAWSMLTTSLDDIKHLDQRVQALAALGTMGGNPRAIKLISDSMGDKDLDVRTAAVLAAGTTKSPNLTTPLRALLDDKEPQVAFAAATTLWKMKDRSGEDILMAVVEGDRRANATLKNGTMHTMSKDLHNPSTLAKIGALQGASVLLGPFGFGITAYEYMKKNGGDSARAQAIMMLSEEKTAPVRKDLLDALGDKDVAVRSAAAKALGEYRGDAAVSKGLADMFGDPKLPVRLTAAAAYLNSVSATAAPVASPVTKHTRTKKSGAE